MRDLDMTSLRLYVTVCETGNISRAAERASIVGSAISKRLAQLEDTVGTPLLVRDGAVHASGDSFIAHAALQANARDNHIDLAKLFWSWADQPLGQGASAALIRVPKELSLLEWQLAALTQSLPAGAPVLIAGMDKHLPRNLVDVLGRYLDAPMAGLGKYKARIFRARVPSQPKAALAPSLIILQQHGWQLRVDAGVFSRQQLDIGARFFMQHIPDGLSGRIADLGCGNGVIGLVAAARNPAAQVVQHLQPASSVLHWVPLASVATSARRSPTSPPGSSRAT